MMENPKLPEHESYRNEAISNILFVFILLHYFQSKSPTGHLISSSAESLHKEKVQSVQSRHSETGSVLLRHDLAILSPRLTFTHSSFSEGGESFPPLRLTHSAQSRKAWQFHYSSPGEKWNFTAWEKHISHPESTGNAQRQYLLCLPQEASQTFSSGYQAGCQTSQSS